MQFTKLSFVIIAALGIIVLMTGQQTRAAELTSTKTNQDSKGFSLPVIEMIGTPYLAIITSENSPVTIIPIDATVKPSGKAAVTQSGYFCEIVSAPTNKSAETVIAMVR